MNKKVSDDIRSSFLTGYMQTTKCAVLEYFTTRECSEVKSSGSSASEETEDIIGIYRIVRTKTQFEIAKMEREMAEKFANGSGDICGGSGDGSFVMEDSDVVYSRNEN